VAPICILQCLYYIGKRLVPPFNWHSPGEGCRVEPEQNSAEPIRLLPTVLELRCHKGRRQTARDADKQSGGHSRGGSKMNDADSQRVVVLIRL
jgi:hypothetical protein